MNDSGQAPDLPYRISRCRPLGLHLLVIGLFWACQGARKEALLVVGSKFKYVSGTYLSNCFVEAFRAKLLNHKVKIYYCRPRVTENGHFQMCHFMWSNGINDYDFSDKLVAAMPWYKSLLFRGQVREFPAGFAEKYAKYRNSN